MIKAEEKNRLILYCIDAGPGDCLLFHKQPDNVKILIDSGPRSGVGKIKVQKALRKILGKDTKIDLAIVTHNDDDHIGGFPDLIAKKIISVDSFIFNDSSYINKIFISNDGKFSLKQDIELQKIIKEQNISLKCFVSNDNCGENYDFIFKGFKFIFLSPNLSKLKRYKKEILDSNPILENSTKLSDCKNETTNNVSFSEIIETIKENDEFQEDSKPANGTSLAFILEVSQKAFLFLGDAHPSVVCENLRKIPNKKFVLCKLAHHGSEKNTSQELLSLMNCSEFLICCDGANNHNHPSLKTIARVLIAFPRANFCFSSRSKEIQKIIEETFIKAIIPENEYLEIIYEL